MFQCGNLFTQVFRMALSAVFLYNANVCSFFHLHFILQIQFYPWEVHGYQNILFTAAKSKVFPSERKKIIDIHLWQIEFNNIAICQIS